MGATKSTHYKKEHLYISSLAKAIAHPARIAILEYLFRIKACVCGDIVEEIGLAQSTISQHLKALKQAGIVVGETEGARVCYCLDMDKINELAYLISCFMKSGDTGECCT